MATVQGIAAATSRITVGTGSAELVVSGYLTPHFKGGLWQVNAMRAEALHLVDSTGGRVEGFRGHGHHGDAARHRAGRVMSHKLVTHLFASIPSCPGCNGTSSAGEEAGSVPVPRRRPAGAWRAISRQSIDYRARLTPGLWPLMAIYFILSY